MLLSSQSVDYVIYSTKVPSGVLVAAKFILLSFIASCYLEVLQTLGSFLPYNSIEK